MNKDLFLKALAYVLEDTMMPVARLTHVTHHLLQTEPLAGDVVEFGCFQGRTTALMTCLTEKPIWVYDSFQGLPAPGPQDVGCLDIFHDARYLKSSRDQVERVFSYLGLRQPRICEGWFKDIQPDQLPDRIAFALLDGDLYESILQGLGLIYPRLVRGGRCVIDDYGWSGLPGARLAADRFFEDKPEKPLVQFTGPDGAQAAFTKL